MEIIVVVVVAFFSPLKTWVKPLFPIVVLSLTVTSAYFFQHLQRLEPNSGVSLRRLLTTTTLSKSASRTRGVQGQFFRPSSEFCVLGFRFPPVVFHIKPRFQHL